MNIYRDSAVKYSRDNIPTLFGRLGFLKYHKILVTAETQQNTPYMDYGQRQKNRGCPKNEQGPSLFNQVKI